MKNLDSEPSMVRIEIDMEMLVKNSTVRPQECRTAMKKIGREIVDAVFHATRNQIWYHRPKKLCYRLSTEIDGKQKTYGRVFVMPERLKTPRDWTSVD